MPADDLNDLERKLVTLSAKRYQRAFYRWGHLLGWLAVPLTALLFVPALKPYVNWISWVAIMLVFEWYFVVTTRVIGKLQARLGDGEREGPERRGADSAS